MNGNEIRQVFFIMLLEKGDCIKKRYECWDEETINHRLYLIDQCVEHF